MHPDEAKPDLALLRIRPHIDVFVLGKRFIELGGDAIESFGIALECGDQFDVGALKCDYLREAKCGSTVGR